MRPGKAYYSKIQLLSFFIRCYRDDYHGYVGSRYWGDVSSSKEHVSFREDYRSYRKFNKDLEKEIARKKVEEEPRRYRDDYHGCVGSRYWGDVSSSKEHVSFREDYRSYRKYKQDLEKEIARKKVEEELEKKKAEGRKKKERLAWEALKTSIHGLLNNIINISNFYNIVFSLIKENIIRGRGLFASSVIQAQAVSPTFTHVYASLVAIINSKVICF